MDSKSRVARRPLLVLSVIFVIVVVIVGTVVWKVTKDTYEDDKIENGGSKGDKTDDKSDDVVKEKITEEELKRHPWKRLRLPRSILPIHYDVTMYPDFYEDAGEFYGNETIQLNVTKPSRYIFIHIDTNYANITDTAVSDNATEARLGIKRTFIYKPNEFFVIEAVGEFKGVIRVSLRFEGSMTKSIVGIYKSSYVNSLTNKTRHLATSKFEPTYARRAFPCLDEPNMKATYTITLVHRPEYIALSNMDAISRSLSEMDPKLLATKFSKSVKMSTYLVCFIVCDFKSVEISSKKNTKIRVFATPDKKDQTDYALQMAKYTMDLYEDIFQIDFPLPKQDLIAIPDFVSGAMEHWGLITFRETNLLYDPNKSTLYNKKRVAAVVAHEMAHMWFGNLVTMDWWNDLWLNEGFASYMEYIGPNKKEPSWDLMTQFLSDELLSVMSLDAVVNSHPIVVTVRDPSEITSVFDAISYSKGASVIRMLDGIMGTEKFFQGIANYLKEFKWGNAKTDDLWNSLSKVDNSINVKSVMDTWTLQDGFPYVNISIKYADKTSTTFHASQKRFMSDPNVKVNESSSPFGYKWFISLDYNTSNGDSGVNIMNKKDVSFQVSMDLSKNNSWIKFNKDKEGFYRVLYPDAMWTSLAKYLTSIKPDEWRLSPADRADLLSDAFNFASSGMLSYEIPLLMSSYLSKETHYVPWVTVISGGLDSIDGMLEDDPDYDTWKEFQRKAIQTPLQKLGFEDKGTFLERRLRALLFDVACSSGDQTAMDNVRLMFHKWLNNNAPPSVNLRAVVYRHGVMDDGNDANWSRVWEKYLIETSPSEKSLLLKALTSTRKPHLVAKLLDRARRGEGIRRQDFFTVVSLLGGNRYARPMVWDWMRQHYAEFEKRFTTRDRYFGRMAYYLVRQFKTPIKLEEVKQFFKRHPDEGSSARYRKMALESITRHIDWIARYRSDVVAIASDLLLTRPT